MGTSAKCFRERSPESTYRRSKASSQAFYTKPAHRRGLKASPQAHRQVIPVEDLKPPRGHLRFDLSGSRTPSFLASTYTCTEPYVGDLKPLRKYIRHRSDFEQFMRGRSETQNFSASTRVHRDALCLVPERWPKIPTLFAGTSASGMRNLMQASPIEESKPLRGYIRRSHLGRTQNKMMSKVQIPFADTSADAALPVIDQSSVEDIQPLRRHFRSSG